MDVLAHVRHGQGGKGIILVEKFLDLKDHGILPDALAQLFKVQMDFPFQKPAKLGQGDAFHDAVPDGSGIHFVPEPEGNVIGQGVLVQLSQVFIVEIPHLAGHEGDAGPGAAVELSGHLQHLGLLLFGQRHAEFRQHVLERQRRLGLRVGRQDRVHLVEKAALQKLPGLPA